MKFEFQKHTIVDIYMNMSNGKLLKMQVEYYASPKKYVTCVWENIWLVHPSESIRIITLSLCVYFTLCLNGICATCIIENAPRTWWISYLVYLSIGNRHWLVMSGWIYYEIESVGESEKISYLFFSRVRWNFDIIQSDAKPLRVKRYCMAIIIHTSLVKSVCQTDSKSFSM